MNSVINLNVLCPYGLPCNIFSNQAHQFVSRRCSLPGNSALFLSPGFSLQSLEQAEKADGLLEKQLQCFLSFLVLADYKLNMRHSSKVFTLLFNLVRCQLFNRDGTSS